MQELFVDFVQWAWGLIIPYMVYLNRKIDKLTEESVRRAEYNGTIDSLRDKIDVVNKNISDQLDKVTARIDRLVELLVNHHNTHKD
jgi:hypothetical protein